MAAFLLRALILLSLSLSSLPLCAAFLPSTPPSFLNAAQTLIDSNHLSMSLTLQLISQSLLPHFQSVTIFAPPDSDFIKFGQPSFSLLTAHFSPRRISVTEIKALPQGSILPMLSPAAGLLVTSSFLDGNLSINNVRVKDFAIFDDGSVVIYAIDHFFNSSDSRIAPSSSAAAPVSSGASGFGADSTGSDSKPYSRNSTGFDPEAPGSWGSDQNSTWGNPNSTGFDPEASGSWGFDQNSTSDNPNSTGFGPEPSGSWGFEEKPTGSDPKPLESSGFDQKQVGSHPKPSGFPPINPVMEALSSLRSRGYVKMATFLDMQLGLAGWPMQGMRLTIFAPIDEALDESVVGFGNYSSLFRAHALPGLLRWLDLVMVKDGTSLETFSEDGFTVSVSKSGDLVVLNGVPVMAPDMYCGTWLVVHGLNKAVWPVEARDLKLSIRVTSLGLDYDADFEDYYGDLDEALGD